MRTIDDTEIRRVVDAFERATITREDWKHVEHMIVGLVYLERYGYERAVEKMRAGILTLLSTGFKVDLSKEMPYHETITIFWLKTLDDLRKESPGKSLMEKANEALRRFGKDHPLTYYSRDLLFSPEARRAYVAPDLKVEPQQLSAEMKNGPSSIA